MPGVVLLCVKAPDGTGGVMMPAQYSADAARRRARRRPSWFPALLWLTVLLRPSSWALKFCGEPSLEASLLHSREERAHCPPTAWRRSLRPIVATISGRYTIM